MKSRYRLCPSGRSKPYVPPPRPHLGDRGTFPFYNGGGHPAPRAGTITYINDPHHWFLVSFAGGLRQCYHFGEV